MTNMEAPWLETPATPGSHNGTGATVQEPGPMALPPRRRWPYVLLGGLAGAASVFAGSTLLDTDQTDGEAELTSDIELATAPVEQRDLVEEVEWAADLGYGEPVRVAAGADGTVTSVTAEGTVLERGQVLATIDNVPLVVMYGTTPAWRDLGEGSLGSDVLQLETNLVALGYDADQTVTIDETYTANTALMVQRWQEDVGIAVDGVAAARHVLVLAGPASIDTVAGVGDPVRADSALAELSTLARVSTVLGSAVGSVTDVAAVDSPVEAGTILYAADGVEVMALVSPDTIGAYLLDPGTDPVSLESALAFAGHDPDGAMVIDDVYDDATAAAVRRWQVANGYPATGQVSSTAYVEVRGGQRVAGTFSADGDQLSVTRPVLDLTTSTLTVVIPVSAADRDEFFVGQELQVELPDETSIAAVVTQLGTITSQDGPDVEPTVDVHAQIGEPVDDAMAASVVTVVVAGETILDALVVPTRALVTLAEGGFAVEKVLGDDSTVLVSVETGTFDDGLVEVVSSQLAVGDQLVVPQ